MTLSPRKNDIFSPHPHDVLLCDKENETNCHIGTEVRAYFIAYESPLPSDEPHIAFISHSFSLSP